MLIYVDSSALVKRSLQEPESGLLVDTLEAQVESGARLFTSSLGTIETTRIIRQRLDQMDPFTVVDLIGAALSGIIEYPITEQVASIAARLGPFSLRSLDAIHLATATRSRTPQPFSASASTIAISWVASACVGSTSA